MKTTEEKAKAYDKAIKVAENIHRFSSDLAEIKRIEQIFPELVESGDERIRKELIEIVEEIRSTTYYGRCCYKEIPFKSILAWLEKQGEHANFRNKIQVGDKVTRNEDGVLVNLSQLNRVAKPTEEYNITGIKSRNAQGKLGEMINRKLEIEKQGEQKSVIEMKSPEESLGISSEEYSKVINDCLYGESKPADKVGPKFKVGDWIVFNGFTFYVKEVIKGFYRTISKGGIPNSYDWNIDNTARPWTIQDAKDGDVLSYRDGQWIFIYKKCVDNNSFQYYVLYSTIHQDLTIDDSAFTLLIDGIVPATKKQRDTLEKAITNAGYRWDADNKELKKIEQKPAEWSEDDELMLTSIIQTLKLTNGTAQMKIDWLKSLKDRYTWKPSEEQVACLQDAIDDYHRRGYKAETLESLCKQLKQL